MELAEALAHGTVCPRCGEGPLSPWFAIGRHPDAPEPDYTPEGVAGLRKSCCWSCRHCGASDMDWREDFRR